MAITLADFTKIWASTSPLTPYSFSESNYREGWNFIGGTPPSRQMWDSIQNQNDEKLKYIVDNFLPTSGGTMTGTIVSNLEAIKNIDDESNIKILGGTDDTSSYIGIWAKNNSATPGVIQLRTSDGTNNKSLLAYPNGDLTWAGNNVVTSNFGTFTVSKTNNMTTLSVQQAIRIGNLAIVSFDGQLSTSSKAAWTDTDIMTFSVATSGITHCIGLTNSGISVLLQVGSNKVTYRTLNHAVNDDTIRAVLVFPVSGF